MAISPDAGAGGPGIGTIWNIGLAVTDQINQWIGGGYNAEERAALEAGRQAGYRHMRTGWEDPTGKRVLERDVIAAGRVIMNPPAPRPNKPPAPRPNIPPPIQATPPISGVVLNPPTTFPFPDYVPNVPPFIAGASRWVLGQIPPLIIAGGLFWPTEAGRGSDLRDYYAVPRPTTRPGRRGRRRRAIPRPRPVSIPRPRTVGRPGPMTISRPRVLNPPRVITASPPAPRPVPPPATMPNIEPSLPNNWPASIPAPGAATAPISAPFTVPSWLVKAATFAAPALLSNFFIGERGASAVQPGRIPDTVTPPAPAPVPLPAPLTSPLTSAVPYARAVPQTETCSCSKTQSKRRKGKKPCKNPVIRSRTVQKNGKTLRYITKEIKCPASSRKKPQSVRASQTTISSQVRRLSTFERPQSSASLVSQVQRELLSRSKRALRSSLKKALRP